MKRPLIILLFLGTGCARPSLVPIEVGPPSKRVELTASLDQVRACIESLFMQDVAPLDQSELVISERTADGMTAGFGALPVGPALEYCWSDTGAHPLLRSRFAVRFSVAASGQAQVAVEALGPVALREKGAFNTSRYQFEELPVRADVEAAIVARAVAKCAGTDESALAAMKLPPPSFFSSACAAKVNR